MKKNLFVIVALALMAAVGVYHLVEAASTQKANMFVNPLTIVDGTNQYLIGTAVGEARAYTRNEAKALMKITNPDYTFETFQDNPVISGSAAPGYTVTSLQDGTNGMMFPGGASFGWNLKADITDGWAPGYTAVGGSLAAGYTSSGLDLSMNGVTGYGVELTPALGVGAQNNFRVGTSPAFYFKAKMYLADVSGAYTATAGFRNITNCSRTSTTGSEGAGYTTTYSNYRDYVMIGLSNASGISITTETDDGGQATVPMWNATTSASNMAWGDGDAAKTLEIYVSAAGVVTFKIDGTAPSTTATYTFTSGTVVAPFVLIHQTTDVCDAVVLEEWECGYQ